MGTVVVAGLAGGAFFVLDRRLDSRSIGTSGAAPTPPGESTLRSPAPASKAERGTPVFFLKPADALSDEDRRFILANFFHAQRARMIEPYPPEDFPKQPRCSREARVRNSRSTNGMISRVR